MSNIRGLNDVKKDDKKKVQNNRPNIQMPRIDNKRVKEITSEKDFDSYLNKIKTTNQLIVVDFYATWCQPCHAMAPKFAELSEKYQDVFFLKVDVEKFENLAEKYNVTSIPYFVFIKKTGVEDRFAGAHPERLENSILRWRGDSKYHTVGEGYKLGSSTGVDPEKDSNNKQENNNNTPQRRPMVIPKQVIIDDKDIVDLPVVTSSGGKLPPEEQIIMVTSMGFTVQQAVKGLQMTGNNAERAVEWIINNPNFDYDSVETGGLSGGGDMVDEIPPETTSEGGNSNTPSNSNISKKTGKPKHHHMAKCDNCFKNIVGTRFKCHDCENYDLCEDCEPKAFRFHDPDHVFLGYDTEYVAPIDEEEKKPEGTTEETVKPNETEEEKKQRLLNKLKKEREEEEFRKQKDELRRRKENKEVRDLQEKWEEEKQKIQREQEKREREAKERYQKEVQEKMEELKRQRMQQYSSPTPNTVPIQPKKTEKDYDSCTIQIKLTNGETLKNDFKTTDNLLAVYNWVSQNRTDGQKPFSLCNTYPRKVFTDNELKTTTLVDAKLVPRGALIISNK